MSSLSSLLPPRTRRLVKEAIGLKAIDERVGVVEQVVSSITVDRATKDAVHVQQTNDRLGTLEQVVNSMLAEGAAAHDPRKDFPTAYWYDVSYAEPCVALALRDFCRPGDLVFDVGANCGALSIIMSRLVGPRGVVCSFEASRRIVDKCQYNLVVNGCHNTQLFHRAVFNRSGEWLKIYHGSHLNDTVMSSHACTSSYDMVETVSLDDFARHFALHPKVIKFDIEGAEFDALLGAQQVLADHKPVLILEQQPSDMRCCDMLKAMGYAGIDLATYQEIVSSADFPSGVDLANVVYVHRDVLDQTPYRLPLARREICRLERQSFWMNDNGNVELVEPIVLDPGRYLIRTRFKAQGSDNDAMAGVEADGTVIFRYHTNTRFLSTAYRDWVIDLPRRQAINLFLRYLNGTSDATLDFAGAIVYQVEAFSSRAGLRPV